MQQTIAAVQSNSTSESRLVPGGKPWLSWLWSRLSALGLNAASALFRMFERFDSGISDSIDIDRVSARLDVVQRAKSDGKNGYPPAGEESISGTQLEIIAHFKELRRRAQRRIDTLADKQRRMRERIDLAGIEGTLRDIPSRCQNEVLRMLAEWQSRMNSFRNEAAERAQRDLRDEKAESGAADQSIPVALQLAFLAALVGGGAIIVGQTSAFGLGADSLLPPVWTFVVLLAVVILSSVTARAVSSSISREGTFWRLRKWLRAGTGIAFTGLACVFASHYLLAMAAAADTSLTAAFGGLSAVFGELLIERTVPLLPFEDWTVFFIVLTAALTAFIVCYEPHADTRRHGTPHGPGRRARKERGLLIRQLRKVNVKIDRADDEVTAILKRAKAAVGKYVRLVDESRQLAAKVSDYDYVLEDACNMLLDRYRAENSKARTTEAPHSFQEHVCFRTEHEGGSSTSADEGPHLDELQQGIRKLESQAGQIRQELRDLNSRAINTLEESALH